MDFECTNDVGYPVEAVHELVRDDMPSIVPFLKDVEEITVLEKKEEPGGVRITNLWRGSASAAPAIVQKFVTRDMQGDVNCIPHQLVGNRIDLRFELLTGVESVDAAHAGND